MYIGIFLPTEKLANNVLKNYGHKEASFKFFYNLPNSNVNPVSPLTADSTIYLFAIGRSGREAEG